MHTRLNVISLFNASNFKEAAHKPFVETSLQGSRKTPCVANISDALEQSKSLLGDRFEATLTTSGPGRQDEFRIGPEKNSDTIDSTHIKSHGSGHFKAEDMAQRISEQWKDNAYNLIHVRGHGHAQRDVLGMPTQEFLKGLNMASQKVGQPLPTLLMESCLMANLEVLSAMSGSVSTVVASQEVLNVEALPHAKMFEQALNGPMTDIDVAGRLVESAAKDGFPDTLVALDVNQLPAVSEATKELKAIIEGPQRKSLKKSVKGALRASTHFPKRSVETHLRKELGLRDLGEVTQSLIANDADPELTQAAINTAKTLEQATIKLTTGANYTGLSGVSIQEQSLGQKSGWDFFGLF